MCDSEAQEPQRKARKGEEDDIDSLSAWMVQNGWVVLDFERHLVKKSEDRPSVLKPTLAGESLVDIFNRHITEDVWSLLMSVVNGNLVKGRSEGNSDWRSRDTNVTEIKKFYAIQMLMENTYGNDTKGHPQAFQEDQGDIWRCKQTWCRQIPEAVDMLRT